VLDVGCGTSTFLQEMYDRDGFKNINAIDLSDVCIKQMDSRNSKLRKEIMFT
jgi:2-polyprenyl-3-methyl-5-hydroxy-6-metoxy-1,4-benzoquinol methylase